MVAFKREGFYWRIYRLCILNYVIYIWVEWPSGQFILMFFVNSCDLLQEKGPTAAKRRFKTQLTAFSLYMLCNIFTSAS